MKTALKILSLSLGIALIFIMSACSSTTDTTPITAITTTVITANTTATETAVTQSTTSTTATTTTTATIEAETYATSGQVVTEVTKNDDAYSSGDTKDVTDSTYDAVITLSGSQGTISDTTRGSSGSQVTITSKGTYKVTGSSDGVTIVVNDETESGNVYLVLENVTMTNSTFACIYVKNADKVIIQCTGNNYITSTVSTAPTDGTSTIDGAIHARDDLTINGEGTLTVKSNLHGIVCKNDLKITGSTLTVTASEKGIEAKESIKIGGGVITITSGEDGIQVSNDDASDNYFYMDGGTLTIVSGQDGIQVDSDYSGTFTGSITLAGGTVKITAGGGSSKSKSSTTSQKGVKCEGDVYIGNVNLTVSSADDAVHSNTSISVTDGTLVLSTSDDGIHADSVLSISGGNVTVSKSYEGLEAYNVSISGGTLSITASDDGINAGGGSDSSSTESNPWGSAASSAILTIGGGNIYVNATGDGLDSNGSMYVTGGFVIVEGPTNGGNGALDIGDGSGCVAKITGGTVLALGTTDMAVNFNSGSQCSALVSLSGSKGTTITVNDGSGFSFTATKSFACAVYSSPYMTKGNSYTITAGSSSATMNFSSSLYYSNVSSMGGGPGRNMGGGSSGKPF